MQNLSQIREEFEENEKARKKNEDKTAQSHLAKNDSSFAGNLKGSHKDIWKEFDSVTKYKMKDGTKIYLVDTPSHGWLYDESGREIGNEDDGITAKVYAKYNSEWKGMASRGGTVITEVKNEEGDIDGVIQALVDAEPSDDNAKQGKFVSLMRGLAFSDDPKATAFMKKLMGAIDKSFVGGSVDEGLNKDEEKILNDLSKAEIKMIKKAKSAVQELGTLMDDERFELLGIDANAEITYEDILKELGIN